MNTTVTATGMSVTANSNTVFLQIKGADDDGYSKTGTTTMTPALFPVSHELKNGKGVETLSTTNVATVGSWWYGYSASPSESTLVTDTATTCTTLTGYVATATFTVNITADSGLATASNLKVKSVTIGATAGVTEAIADGVSVIIVGPNGLAEFKTSSTTGSETVIATSIPKDTATITITAYIYIDGENAAVKTVDREKLAGTISFELVCDATVYA